MSTSASVARLVVDGVEGDGSTRCDLTVAAGELVAVNGEGSAALLRVVAGAATPRQGRVLIDGRPVADPLHDYALGVVLIPQGNGLAQLLTAAENVLLPLVARPGAADAPTTARRALAAVGLADSADHLIEELSGGQQQRVAVARALALRPRLLLADQATTDLDPANRARVMTLFRELAATGTAVVLASDDPAVASSCDRVVQT